MNEFVRPEEFLDLVRRQTLMVDVRAPVEFSSGHWPGAINLPLLEDDERVLVGTCYKEQGSEKALELGHKLVSGAVKDRRLQEWLRVLGQTENSVLTCYRGGLRSQISQAWCREAGLCRSRVQGGERALRQFLLSELATRLPQTGLLVLSGPTGSGKTDVLRQVADKKITLDLEAFAHHRGSAFGAMSTPQPTQVNFENQLIFGLIKAQQAKTSAQAPLIIEDESRMIGSCVQPEILFLQLRESPLVVIEESVQSRAELILKEYVAEPFNQGRGALVMVQFREAIRRITRKLGGVRATEILKDMDQAEAAMTATKNLEAHLVWITKLLLWYYDPLYQASFEKRRPSILFRGSRVETTQFLLGYHR